MIALYRFLILSFIIILPLIASAQPKKQHKPPKSKHYKFFVFSNHFKVNEAVSIFGATGVSNYYGDLCDGIKCTLWRPNFGIGMIYRLSKHISSKSELNYFRLASKDTWKGRNLNFRSSNLEVYSSLMYDLYKFNKNFKKRKLFSPYLFVGIGVVFYNPRGELNGKWYNLRPLQTEGTKYGIATPIVPFGIGVKIKHTRNWDFLAEIGYRITFSDHLDDVSSYKFKKIGDFDDPTAAAISNKTQQGDNFLGYRGNPRRKDGYVIIDIKARYTFTLKHAARNKYIEQHRKIY
jgi:hypothetical protein